MPQTEAAGDDAQMAASASSSEHEEDPEPGEQQKLPGTKAEVQKLRESYENTMVLVGHFFHDRSLQDDLRCISLASEPYRKEYTQMLLQQKTQEPANASQSTLITLLSAGVDVSLTQFLLSEFVLNLAGFELTTTNQLHGYNFGH